MAKQTLGRIITRDTANAEINRFLQIREFTNAAIQAAIKPFGGGAVTYHSDTEISFIFDMDTLNKLIKLIGEGNFNGLRVYYAAAHQNEVVGGKPRVLGSTTIVLVPCMIDYDVNTGEVKGVENIVVDDSQAAIEYPGGSKEDDLTKRIDIGSAKIIAPKDPVVPQNISFIP